MSERYSRRPSDPNVGPLPGDPPEWASTHNFWELRPPAVPNRCLAQDGHRWMYCAQDGGFHSVQAKEVAGTGERLQLSGELLVAAVKQRHVLARKVVRHACGAHR